MYTIKSFETENYKHYIGYGRTAKTTYEQQQERRAELIYMSIQKGLGVIVAIGSIVGISYGIIELVVTFVIGIALVCTKDHSIG